MKYWINDGSVLKDGSISYQWLSLLYWRTSLVLILQYLTLMILVSLDMKIRAYGVHHNDVVPDVVVRPSEDAVTIYSFVK